MEPWVDDLADDLQSMSFNSTLTATTNTEIANPSARSSSETTLTAVSSSISAAAAKRHYPRRSGDTLSDAVYRAGSAVTLPGLRFLRRLGAGDIGAVYLAELRSAEGHLFAVKVMDRKELAGRNKEGRAATEREILEKLEHPFLPKLYASVDSPKWWCLLTEFCPGGDLHVLRQRQPAKRFDEPAVRFYAAEVVVALEYLHMMGIVYRDLKPENVLVRSDGHIMLTDFDLSLKCDKPTAQIIGAARKTSPSAASAAPGSGNRSMDARPCILPSCIVPAVSCFRTKHKLRSWRKPPRPRGGPPPGMVAEPVEVRSMSFVGTHEYLAPEIVSGDGHGSAVDWWTLGVFIFELLLGVTPFKGPDNELTLANIVARALEFPKEPAVSAGARELVAGLLVKDPERRLGAATGASAVKNHPFFRGVNWALLRCAAPPFVPAPFSFSRDLVSEDESCPESPMDYY